MPTASNMLFLHFFVWSSSSGVCLRRAFSGALTGPDLLIRNMTVHLRFVSFM